MGSYCCKKMAEADAKGWIDYCEPTTVDLETYESRKDEYCKFVCVPINFCPFCGKVFESAGNMRRIMEDAIMEIDAKENDKKKLGVICGERQK